MASRYSGPNRPNQHGTSKTSPSKLRAGGSTKQPSGKPNKNPSVPKGQLSSKVKF